MVLLSKLALITTIISSVLFTNSNSQPQSCNACSSITNGCHEFTSINSRVVACKCAFSGGVLGGKPCCADGYHMCTSGKDLLDNYGFTKQVCESTIPTDEGYFTLESNTGNVLVCNSKRGTNGKNDVWACAGPGTSWSGCPHSRDKYDCWGLNNPCITNFGTAGNPFRFAQPSNLYGEWNTLEVTDDTRSGVLCCKDPTPPTIVPTVMPTINPTEHTSTPTQSPTADLQSCNILSKKNILFLMDKSGNMEKLGAGDEQKVKENFNKAKEFVQNIIDNEIDINTNIGIIEYSNPKRHSLQFTKDRTQISQTIDNINYVEGIDYLDFTVRHGIRLFNNINTNDNLIILIKDNSEHDINNEACDSPNNNYQNYAQRIQNELNRNNVPNIDFLVIGLNFDELGSNLNINQFNCLVNDNRDLLNLSVSQLDSTLKDLCILQSQLPSN